MIAEIFLSLIMGLFTNVFNLINTIVPSFNATADYINLLAQILNISNQSLNFVHFIIGDHMAIIIPGAFLLLTYKYIGLPIIDTLRRLIPFVNL